MPRSAAVEPTTSALGDHFVAGQPALSAQLGSLFVPWERRSARPMLDIRL